MSVNKQYFHMHDKHISNATVTSKYEWAVALLLLESGKYSEVSVSFDKIKIFKSTGQLDRTYSCSQDLHNWQKKAIKGLLVNPIIVVLNHKEMTADILKSKFARYISVARKVVSGWQAK